MARSKALAKAQDKYSEDLKRVWVGEDLEKILKSGCFGDTVIESSRTLVTILKEHGLI